MISRTTIMADDTLIQRVSDHTKKTGEKLSEFYSRAILNQLENDGDFEIRDLVTIEIEEDKTNGN